MERIKKISIAFLLGGIFGVLCSLLLQLYGLFGLTGQMGIAASLVTLSLLGGLLYQFDLYQKIEKAGGAGALLPITGLAVAVSHQSEAAKKKGASTGKAIGAGFAFIGKDAGAAILICFVIGIVAMLVQSTV